MLILHIEKGVAIIAAPMFRIPGVDRVLLHIREDVVTMAAPMYSIPGVSRAALRSPALSFINHGDRQPVN